MRWTFFAWVLAAGLLFAAPAGAAGPGAERHIVVLENSVQRPGGVASQHARRFGAKVTDVYRSALRGYAATLPARAAATIARDSRVAFVEADQRVEAFAQQLPTGIERSFASANVAIGIDGVDEARVDADVAVIDGGVDLDHPDLDVVASTNCARGGPRNKGGCVNGEGDDGNGHGTHVAGTIAAIDNGFGVAGVAPGARLWNARVLDKSGSGWMSWIVAGVDWVTARAGQIEVANMSLGCACASAALDQAIAASVDAGVVYAVAAGNEADDVAGYSPANHPDTIAVSALADYDGLPGAAAGPSCRDYGGDDSLAGFSNWGAGVEVAAPGVCILSTWAGGGYETISGTSMATPHVAGAAALLASVDNPGSGADVEAIGQAIAAAGNFDWIDSSGDGTQEPLLDLGDEALFAPVTVPGSGEGEEEGGDGEEGGGSEEPPDGEGEEASGVHVADLDPTAINQGGTWTAVVDVLVHDATGSPLAGAVVDFSYASERGSVAPGAATCTTGADGRCAVSVGGILKRDGGISFTVTGIAAAEGTYSSADNHDPDGDSDGTAIAVSKP
jgi:subtilisin family serine protease